MSDAAESSAAHAESANAESPCDCECASTAGFNLDAVLKAVRDKLSSVGIEFEDCCSCINVVNEAQDSEDPIGDNNAVADGKPRRVKVVCVAPDLQSSMQEMGKTSRGHVVMVRVDEATSRQLDAWVETGAVKSRSEAAALFIREGMRVRAKELESLEDALRDVEDAKAKLREKAREIFGADDASE